MGRGLAVVAGNWPFCSPFVEWAEPAQRDPTSLRLAHEAQPGSPATAAGPPLQRRTFPAVNPLPAGTGGGRAWCRSAKPAGR